MLESPQAEKVFYVLADVSTTRPEVGNIMFIGWIHPVQPFYLARGNWGAFALIVRRGILVAFQ